MHTKISFRFAMPHTPLRYLKPELFTDEQHKMNTLTIEETESDADLMNDSEDSSDGEDIQLHAKEYMEETEFSDDEEEDELNESIKDDVPLLCEVDVHSRDTEEQVFPLVEVDIVSEQE